MFYIWTIEPEAGFVGWGFVREVRLPRAVKSSNALMPDAAITGSEVAYFSKVVPRRLFEQNPSLGALQVFAPDAGQTIYRVTPEEAREINSLITDYGFRPPPIEGLDPHVDAGSQPDAASAGLTYPWQGYVTASALNLRKGPGVNFSIVTVVPGNSMVMVTDREGEWLKVLAGTTTGYAAAQYITAGTPEPSSAPSDIPEMSLVLDLSKWQKIADPASVPQQVAGAYIRTSEGTRVDEAFAENWAAARSTGLLVGPYHVWDPDSDPEQQAGVFIKTVRSQDDPGDMVPVVTVEKPGDPAALKALIEAVRGDFSRPVVIYTSQNTWKQLEGADWAAEYPLWVAQYRTNIDLSDPESIFRDVADRPPQLPNAWRTSGWALWQFTNLANGPQYGLTSSKATLSVAFAGREALIYQDVVPVSVTPPAVLIPDRASFNNDTPGQIDSLNFSDYVSGFARLLADTDVRLPIAVGLFGNWGVGKTHFINMLKRDIADLVGRHAADRPKPRYVRRVSQITFNAWHYIDTNLWASLAIHIFDALSKEIKPQASNYFEARRELRTSLSSSKFSKNEAQSRRNQAKLERRAQLQELENCRKAREEKAREWEKGRWQNFLSADLAAAADREKVEEIAKQFGLGAVLETADDAVLLSAEFKSVMGRGSSLATAFARQFSTTRQTVFFVASGLAFLAAVLILFGPGVTWLQSVVPALESLWSESINTVMQVASLAAGALTWAGKKMSRLRDGIEMLEKLQRKLEAGPAHVEPSAAEKELAASIDRLDTEIEAAEQKIRAAEKTIAETQAELQRIDEGGLVYDFLNLRLHDPRYTENLGMISVIRQDLDDLQGLLREWGSTDDSTSSLPPIERIILYIDDLDRCPLDKVVEVLQAVHLLLAFELFVVVVAVDPRWLERSLLKAYVPETGQAGRTDSFSAQNYLEKIFQIPFSIPGMTQAGYQNLVDDLIETRRESEPADGEQGVDVSEVVPDPAIGSPEAGDSSPVGEEGPEEDAPLGDGNVGGEPAGRPDVAAPDGGEQVVSPPVEIPPFLEDREEAFLKLFGAFVETPRLTKRLINIYRLLRFQIGLEEGRFLQFIDAEKGQYLAVIMLMAMNIGYPKIGGRLLRVLHDERISGTWDDFLIAVDPANGVPAKPAWLDPTCISDLDPVEYSAMMADFADVRRLAAELEEPITIPEDVAVYRTWAVEVSRFSFDWYRG